MKNFYSPQEGIKEYEIIINDIPVSVCLKRNFITENLIVFFHGLGCSKNIFYDALTHTELQNQSLLLIDFPGFGKSGKPDNFSYSMEEQAMVCEKLLDLFPDVRLHIVAHSMGGAVPLLFSDRTLKRIDSFANLEGNLINADCAIFSRSIAGVSLEEYSTNLFEKQKSALANIPELKFDETTPLALYRSAVSLVEWSDSGSLLEKFQNLKCRKIYIYGEENKDLETINHLTGIDKIMIPGAGHSMMLDNPDKFYQTIHNFIFDKKD